MKVVHIVHIVATFPELRGKRAHQTARGKASTTQAALGAAMRDLVKQKTLRRQRYTEFSAKFTIARIEEEDETTPVVESQCKDGIGDY